MQHAFSYAGGRLDVSLNRSGTKLKGDVGGHQVVYVHISGAGGEEAPGYLCGVGYSGGPLGIKLRIEGRMRWTSRSESGPRLRRSTVTTGDELFDASWLIRTSEPDRLLNVLDRKVRKTILDLGSGGRLRIHDKGITLKEPFKNPEGDMIVRRVRKLVSLAEAIEKSRT